MVKNILLVSLGLFFFLFLMGTLFINKAIQSPEFAEMKAPPDVLETPMKSPIAGIKAVRVPGTDTITLGQGARNGLSFVNFWAPWCRPCLSELPTIEKLYQAQNGKMEYFIISTDGPENQIRAFMKRKGYNFPAYRLVKTPQTDSLDRILPLTALSLGSEALIYHKGAANWNSEVVHQLVEELAGPPKN